MSCHAVVFPAILVLIIGAVGKTNLMFGNNFKLLKLLFEFVKIKKSILMRYHQGHA